MKEILLGTGKQEQIRDLEGNVQQLTVAGAATVYEHSGAVDESGRIYFVAGRGSYVGAATNKVWRYDPNSNIFTAIATIPNGVISTQVGIIGNSLYIYSGDHATSNSAQSYSQVLNLNTLSWTTRSITSTYRRRWAGCWVYDNRLYLYGGNNSSDNTSLNQVFSYTPTNHSYIVHSNSGPADRYIKTVVLDGYVYCLGFYSAFSRYSLLTNTWQTLSVPGRPLQCDIATYNKKIYLLGGTDNYNLMEYNPTTKQWRTVPFKGDMFFKNNQVTNLCLVSVSDGLIAYGGLVGTASTGRSVSNRMFKIT